MRNNPLIIKEILKKIDKYYKFFNFASFIFLIWGFISIFHFSPDDYQQGDSVKIMYLHVPCAWMSLLIYLMIGCMSIIYLSFKISVCSIIAQNLAPIGLIFSLITLVTGSVWGRPIWGTWWAWDPRLTSFLILTSFYIAYVSYNIINKYNYVAHNNGAIIIIIGLINLPIVKFSVELWASLHQPTSLFKKTGPAIDKEMLKPLIIMLFFFVTYTISLLMVKIRRYLYEKKLLALRLREI